jgi:hypothetical protein
MKGDPASTQTPLVALHMGTWDTCMYHVVSRSPHQAERYRCNRLPRVISRQRYRCNGGEGEAQGGVPAPGDGYPPTRQCATYSPSLARMPLTGHRMPQNRLAARGA